LTLPNRIRPILRLKTFGRSPWQRDRSKPAQFDQRAQYGLDVEVDLVDLFRRTAAECEKKAAVALREMS
jgi:hypothetical protein